MKNGLENLKNKIAAQDTAALYDDSYKPCFICNDTYAAINIKLAAKGKCNAVALTDDTSTDAFLKTVKNQKPTATFILSFNADDAGQIVSEKVSEELKTFNIPFIPASYSNNYTGVQYKNPNDLFKSNRKQFELDIQSNIKDVMLIRKEGFKKHDATNAKHRLKAFINGIKDSVNTPCIPTGFKELDAELDGGLYPGLYVIGAISSLGKTTLMLQIADQIAAAGHDILYFSMEMAASELMSKTISRLTYLYCENERYAKTARGITTISRYKNYNQNEKDLIFRAEQAYSRFADHLYFYEGMGDIGVNEIRDIVSDHKEHKGKAPIVFIDYLQILAPYDKRASDKQNTDKAVLELKRLSRDFKMPVVTISSFNRDSYKGEVTMSAFKESGAIEYGCDVLLALQPQGMIPGNTKSDQNKNSFIIKQCKRSIERNLEVVVLKNRSAPTGGKVGFKYNAMFNGFEIDNTYLSETSKEDSVIPYGAQTY